MGAGVDLSRFPLDEIGIRGKREMLAVRVLEGAARVLSSGRCPDPADRAGQRVRSTSSRRRSIFPGPKRSLTCARILSGRASAFFAASDRGALLRHADCMA